MLTTHTACISYSGVPSGLSGAGDEDRDPLGPRSYSESGWSTGGPYSDSDGPPLSGNGREADMAGALESAAFDDGENDEPEPRMATTDLKEMGLAAGGKLSELCCFHFPMLMEP
jgi:hypothetical protein